MKTGLTGVFPIGKKRKARVKNLLEDHLMGGICFKRGVGWADRPVVALTTTHTGRTIVTECEVDSPGRSHAGR
jgi:hypothetical protein